MVVMTQNVKVTCSHMLFSWLIYRQLGEVLQAPQPDTADEEGMWLS